MKSLVDWLITIEYRAHDIYARASEIFRHDAVLSPFLRDLASDELCHVQFMKTAADVLDDSELSPIALDEKARAPLEEPFDRIEKFLSSDSLTVEQLLDCVVDTEFSEWNDLHSFVMTKLQERGPFFMRMVAAIEQHRKYISQVLGSMPGGRERLELYGKLPHVWRERILIVDDALSIQRMLSAVCRDLGAVTVAGNGAEALERLGQSYFDAIISDVDMPVMNGLEFFSRAAVDDPLIRDRFVFFTGALSEREVRFFEENRLCYLEKPIGISRIKQVVCEVMGKATRRVNTVGTDGVVPLGCLESFLVTKMGERSGAGRVASPETSLP